MSHGVLAQIVELRRPEFKVRRNKAFTRWQRGGLKLFRPPPIVGVMERARTVIVGGIVTAALMKYRTKTTTSWTEAVRRYEEGRRRTSSARRNPDRAEDRRRYCCPVRARPVLPFRALSARPGLPGASDRGPAFRFDGHWRGIQSDECDGSRRARRGAGSAG